jgi:hypothetical protein
MAGQGKEPPTPLSFFEKSPLRAREWERRERDSHEGQAGGIRIIKWNCGRERRAVRRQAQLDRQTLDRHLESVRSRSGGLDLFASLHEENQLFATVIVSKKRLSILLRTNNSYIFQGVPS